MNNLFDSLIRRLIFSLLLIVAVIVFNFILIKFAPGDPAIVIAGEMGGSTPEILAEIRKDYGLDQPLHIQLGTYVKRLLNFNLGQSFYYQEKVSVLILERAGPTFLLGMTGLIMAFVLGTFLGNIIDI